MGVSMKTESKNFLRNVLASSMIIAAQMSAAMAQKNEPQPQRPPETLGGTIDVVIGNGNGLAAVTDSRLSDGHGHVSDHGEKMILMDDHTLCVLAGWYSNPGPTLDDKTFPAYSAVPGIIRSFAHRESSASKASPVENRIAALARDVAFTLNAVQQIAQWAGNKTRAEPSELTLATSVGDHIEVARMDISPVPEVDGGFGFVPTLRRKFEVKDVVEYEVAGIEDVGRPLLGGTDTRVDDPTLLKFRQAVTKDGGRSLSLEDMIETARETEILTSKRFGNVVGGPIEIGTIEHGKAKIEQENLMLTPQDRRASALFSIMEQVTVSGGGMNLEMGDGIVLFTDSQMRSCNQKIDGMLLYNNLFLGCALTYDGSPKTIFDASNKVPGSVLVLTKREYLETPLVVQIRKDFPDLRIGIKKQPVNTEIK